MIDRSQLLDDLKQLVSRVESDLLARSEDADVPEIAATLEAEYDRARAAKRTAATFSQWREDRITQAAVAWVLSSVFVRYLEDNNLISPPRLSGPGERLRLARDAHQHYFQNHPRETDREYLLSIFDELAALPGTAGIFGDHNALREIPAWLSGDAAREILQFFQKADNASGTLIHDFTDASGDTRFLGDLYQDLSAEARSRYALLQTPNFIEQFLLDRTLEPALDEFGLSEQFKMIDPACGSGHLVLGSFERLLNRWQRAEPATPARELVRRTLASLHGVDINPFAAAIARFRLLLAAMRACGVTRLADAPAFELKIECGDSLLHTPLLGGQTELFDKHDSDAAAAAATRGRGKKAADTDEECEHAYASENLAALKAVLRHGQYHAVMANPPYIVVRDAELNQRYRKRFSACHRQYSLAVPFMEHIYGLCTSGGFTGQITANSFMKREFGKKLIEQFFKGVDLTHVIDTSGAYIPGHGTPTVILFGRRRPPVADTVRAVMGIRGEPSTPEDPSQGLVWTAITGQVDEAGSQSDYVSVADTPRATFHAHPWSIGGGGAAELKATLERLSSATVGDLTLSIGRTAHTGEDDAYVAETPDAWRRSGLPDEFAVPFIEGNFVRDWNINETASVVWPYTADGTDLALADKPSVFEHFWRTRTVLSKRREFGSLLTELGQSWFGFSRYIHQRFLGNGLAFAFVATHNHFVLDRGGKVFKQSAPVIKLPPEASEDDHLALLGILNSSTACFWMKQVMTGKHMGDGGEAHADPAGQRFEFSATGLQSFPLPASNPLDLTRQLQTLADANAKLAPAEAIALWTSAASADPPLSIVPTLKQHLADTADTWESNRRRMIALQEELDWQTYHCYGLTDAPLTHTGEPPAIDLGERAFEIVMARRIAADDLSTTWFERHGSTPITEIPAHWPADYRDLVEQRIATIEANSAIGLIEQPEYKRRWNTAPWAEQQAAALETFLLDRLERLCDFDGRMNDGSTPTATLPQALISIGQLADAASRDPLFMEAAELFVGQVGFDLTTLVSQLVESTAVPLLPVCRYKASGLRKHADWKRTWDLQRAEDAIDARTTLGEGDPQKLTKLAAEALKAKEIGDIPVPPKYTSADFAHATYWKHRGKLDVPKERFVSFPGVVGGDGTPLIAWAGLDHLQLAKAIGDFYGLVQTELGGSHDPRLVPLLAGLHELIPWIRQWHAGNDPIYGGEPAGFFADFLKAEAASMSTTAADILAWEPPKKTSVKRAKKASKKAAKKTKPAQAE